MSKKVEITAVVPGDSVGVSEVGFGIKLIYSALSVLAGALLFAGCVTTGASSASVSSGVHGVVTAPVEGVYIFVYEKGADPHGPPYTMSEASASDGSFNINLPDGDYTIVARKHKNGLPGSPLDEGDQKSETISATVKGGKLTTETLLIKPKSDDVKFFDASPKSDTSLSGKVLDSDGNPRMGFRIHVYTYAQMSERPKYVSAATGPDGKFVVYLPKGGTYYLSARDHFGGPPKIGDFFGRYDEGTIDPSGIIVKTGQKLDNINITVHKVW